VITPNRFHERKTEVAPKKNMKSASKSEAGVFMTLPVRGILRGLIVVWQDSRGSVEIMETLGQLYKILPVVDRMGRTNQRVCISEFHQWSTENDTVRHFSNSGKPSG